MKRHAAEDVLEQVLQAVPVPVQVEGAQGP
jgi:CO dehydrogenase/acetyl-CoA synthase delta subunit